MGEALLMGMLAQGHSVLVAESNPERAEQLGSLDAVTVCSAGDAAAGADIVIVAVKPPQVAPLIAEVAAVVRPSTPIISVAAGVTLEALARAAGQQVPVIRAMPNTPALVGQGMVAISPGATCTATQTELAVDILSAVGEVVVVPESEQDAVTALSGSGPAYLFLVAEAMIDAGIELGLPEQTARQLATQTIYGAASMLRDAGQEAATLRANVTSPNGTTAAAIESFEGNGLRSLFESAMRAARDRSIEMSQELP